MKESSKNGIKLWDRVPGVDFDESVDGPALNSRFLDGD